MKNEFFVLVLQNLILFPNQEVKLELSNNISKNVIKNALNNNGEILIVSPRDELEIRPNIKDLPTIATFAKIKNCITLPKGNMRITLRGINRSKIKNYRLKNSDILATTEAIENPIYNLDEENAYIRRLKSLVNDYVSLSETTSNSVIGIIKNVTSLSKLTDIISVCINFGYQNKWKLLNEINYYKRAKKIVTLLNSEISSLKFDKKLEDEIRENFQKNEKEIFIKEKINLLSRELGINNDIEKECANYLDEINKLKIDDKIKTDLEREVKRLATTVDTSPEFSIIRSHLDFITNLPWNKETTDNKDIKEIDKSLNATHYGLDRAKERIEEYLSLKLQNKNLNSPVLCLVGPPGTGKTTFARELAKSVGREFIKISVGGLNDSAELIGHRRTYIGACPGKIMEGIRKCGVNNPIILIDEVDKMVKDYKGDPASILLDILDQNQNKFFVDNYVGEPFDLSNVLFILTANEEQNIPNPLLDRLEVIEVNSYTMFDKIEIAKKYTLPRLGIEYNFDYRKLNISDKVIMKIVNEYTHESGVRELERQISSIVRKILLKNTDKSVTIKEDDLIKYLGNAKYSNYINTYTKSGVVNVPAYTETGGVVLNIECSIYEGDAKIITTGSIGDVMKESILVAVSHLKTNAKDYKIDAKKLSKTIHVHALDGASKKEGPSAGLAILISILSVLQNKLIPNDIAFTGEITLEGKILKVGGIKEKIISSYNSGIRKVFIPQENQNDLYDIPKKVLNNIEIIPVNDFTEVYKNIFD